MREETPYDTSKYKMQPNPELPEAGGVKLAENEKEVLLLELFPMVAKTYLTNCKKAAYEKSFKAKAAKAVEKVAEAASALKDKVKGKVQELKEAMQEKAPAEPQPITGNTVNAPLPGRVIAIAVKVGDRVKADQEVLTLEAMKMENSITTDYAGTVKQILVSEGETVPTDAVLIEIE